MSHDTMPRTKAPATAPANAPAPEEQSTGQLVSRVSQDVTQLVRDELRLAQAEMTGKAKQAGIGAGMFGAAGLLAFYGGGVLIAAIVLALALVLPGWASALIVAAVLFAAAGVAALLGKNRVTEATPMKPERTVENVKKDVDAARSHS